MDNTPPNRPVTMPAIVTFIFLCPIVVCGIVFGPSPIDIPWPTPQAVNLHYLPLPDAAITPGPAVTPDWGNEDTHFTRRLNSQVEIYTNRFGLQWTVHERLWLTLILVNGQYSDLLPAYLRQSGTAAERQWRYGIVFPWPLEPFVGELVQEINGTLSTYSGTQLDNTATGPAGAVFEELNPDPQMPSDDAPLARCRHHVHGQITLTSVSPVVGNFQFACQFDATEYALVSGWFWE